jgi:hypothetical protein
VLTLGAFMSTVRLFLHFVYLEAMVGIKAKISSVSFSSSLQVTVRIDDTLR